MGKFNWREATPPLKNRKKARRKLRSLALTLFSTTGGQRFFLLWLLLQKLCIPCFRLVETGFAKKNDYMAYLKDYMKKVVKYLEENNRAGEVDTFKKNINGVMKGLLGKFNDLQFYQGRVLFSILNLYKLPDDQVSQ